MVSKKTRFYCKSDMTSSWFRRQEAFQVIFHDGFWKSDRDFLIAFQSNFLFGMHGFRDSKVSLPTGNDVIRISLLGGISHGFCWWNLKERPQFHNHGSLTYFTYLTASKLFNISFWLVIACVLGVKQPQISQLHITHPEKGLPYTRPSLLSYCARKLVHGYGL